MTLAQRLLAELLERIFGNKVTSIIGVLVVAAGAIAGGANVIPATVVFHGIHVRSVLLTASAIIGGVALLLAKDAGVKVPNPPDLSKFGTVLLAALLLPAMAHSQSAVNATIPTAPAANLIHNLYAGGVSYNSSATPAVAGTGLYARLLSDTGTYAFTDVDALPNTVRPFTVTTNMGVGVAQKVATIGTVPVFIPAATGISFSGSNTGWQWNTGALAAIGVKGNYFVMPQVRLVKSSVSNGSGYQPIIGVLFAWGT